MRETMRDNSVRRKPVRAASRPKPATRPFKTRKGSSSQVNIPVTRTPSPNDAVFAAQAAQTRINEITPPPKAFTNFSHHRYPTPVKESSTSPAKIMTNYLDTTTRQHRHFQYDPEDVQLKDFGSLRSGSAQSKVTRPHPSESYHASRKKQVLSKAKEVAVNAMNDYIDMWKDRKKYPSDEHVGIEMIKDYVQQRKQKKQDAKWAASQAEAQSPQPRIHQPGTVAWPGGTGVPLSRAPTPSVSSRNAIDGVPTPPRPGFNTNRNRMPSQSVYTTRTDVTTWGKIQKMVGYGNTTPTTPTDPEQNFFASAFVSRDKGKGRVDDRSWNPESHVFDPDRESYPSAAPGNRYRANTVASSIYSQPSAIERPRIQDYPPPPSVPGEYAHLVAKPHIESDPILPLTVNASISAFQPPKTSVRNTGRREGGDWTDSYYGGKQDDGRVSPLLAEPLKPRPNGNPAGQARGTQFYDFYRDSGFVFNRAD